ncbi:MAG: glutathione S-transferase family protein [Casimicrobiaceae bacterium]
MYTLYIGNKNFSSWSLRSWVLLRQAGIPFREQMVSLYAPNRSERIRAVSPNARVPCLCDGDTLVWDTLAIAEYLAERHPGLWPAARAARAWARCAAAEMHSGFADLRNELSMDLRVREKLQPGAAAATDIARIDALWREGRSRFGGAGDFLCGGFGIVDAFWCPVAFRFQSYGITLAGPSLAYQQALLALPAMVEWGAAAAQEREGPDAEYQAQHQ